LLGLAGKYEYFYRWKGATPKKIAMSLPTESYQTVKWREGTSKKLSSRFAALQRKAESTDALISDGLPSSSDEAG
jgi:hypothetical protein